MTCLECRSARCLKLGGQRSRLGHHVTEMAAMQLRYSLNEHQEAILQLAAQIVGQYLEAQCTRATWLLRVAFVQNYE